MQRPNPVRAVKSILSRWVPERVRRAILRFLDGDAGAARLAKGAARRLELKSMPLLSVIIPVYNVEEFLAEALDSVLAQTYTNLEIIVVDDGATDSSPAICDEYARRHKSITVIHQANGGLGNARNVGARAATGTYIAFMDSDDLIYPHSYEVMVRSLEASGSDMVTGNCERFNSARTWPAWNQKDSHALDRSAIHMDEVPELIYDTTAWNKMFRRDFYERIEIFFPERKLYEDMVPMLKSLLEARTLDVISASIYKWRQRDGQNSITQRRNEFVNLRDKLEMMHLGHDLIVDHGHPEMLGLFFKKAFGGDLLAYIRHLGEGDDAFDAEFLDAVTWFWPTQSGDAAQQLAFNQRVFYTAVVEHGLAVGKSYWQWCLVNRFRLPTRTEGNVVRVDVERTDLDLPPLPADAWELYEESQLDVTATSAQWVDGRLRLEGWAFIPHDEDPAGQVISIEVVGLDGTRIPLDVTPTVSVAATAASKDQMRDHDHTGFEAWLAPQALAGIADQAVLDFVATVTRGELTRSAPIVNVIRTGAVRAISAQPIGDWLKARLVQVQNSPLRLSVLASPTSVTSIDLVGRDITAEFDIQPGQVMTGAWIENEKVLVKRPAELKSVGDAHRITANIPESSAPRLTNWFLVVDFAGGTSVRLDLSADVALDSSRAVDALWLDRFGAGHLTVVDRPQVAEVEEIEILDDKKIRLTGSAAPDAILEFGYGSLKADPAEWITPKRDGRTFDVTFDLGADGIDGIRRPIKSDRYEFHVRSADPAGQGGRRSDWIVRSSYACAQVNPVFAAQADANIEVYLTTARKLRFRIDPPLRPDEQSAYWREQFAAKARAAALETPGHSAFMTTYFGFEASDSPRAIHVELGKRDPSITRYWGVVDHSVVLPEGAVPVIKNSEAWYDAIASSTWLINNVGSIYKGYERLPHQIDIQTWHGTPLKVIGLTLKEDEGKTTDEMEREGKEWDYLVSQSPFYSEVIGKDLGTNAVVLETGYPRNDELFTTTPEQVEGLRASLGIPAGVKVALYAPTWRDNTKVGYAAPLFEALDLDAFSASLGPDWVVLLRGHGFNARANDGSRSRNAVIDVTQHPSISELYLVSDALVTDYSSVMFDYCNLGRPILFYVPDYDHYMSMRRTYFDLREVAPGPVLDTQEDLHAAFAKLDSFEAEFGDKYAAFKQRFAPWDDAHATERVVDAILTRGKPVRD